MKKLADTEQPVRRRGRVASLLPIRVSSLGIFVTTTVLVLSFGAAAAFAYVHTGSGSGTANTTGSAGQTISFTASTPSPAPGLLYPGQSANVAVKIVNPYSSQAITITGLTGIVTTSDQTNCPGASNFTVAINPSGMPGSIVGGATFNGTLTSAVAMNTTAASACQGKTITVSYSVTGKLG